MRFKCQFRKDTLPTFLSVVSSLARFSKSGKANQVQSFAKFTVDKLYLNVRNVDLVEAYAEFNTRDVFHDGFTLESKRDNMIGLAVQMQNLHDALKSGAHCERITARLSKRQGQGVLSFEFNDPLMENVWITQDCPVQPLIGEYFTEASTPDIPSCEWNVELPPAKRLINVLLQIQKIGNDSVEFSFSTNANTPNVCEIELSTASDLVSVTTRYAGCQMFVEEPKPKKLKMERYFKAKRVQSALKVTHDAAAAAARSQDGSVILAIPEDEASNPWMCVVSSLNSVDSCRLFCVVPTQFDG